MPFVTVHRRCGKPAKASYGDQHQHGGNRPASPSSRDDSDKSSRSVAVQDRQNHKAHTQSLHDNSLARRQRHHRRTDQRNDSDTGEAERQPIVASLQEELNTLHGQNILSQRKGQSLAGEQRVRVSRVIRGEHVLDNKDDGHERDYVVGSLAVHVESKPGNRAVDRDSNDDGRVDRCL